MAVSPPVCDFDWPAPDFALPSTDGRVITRGDAAGPNGLLVMFICNHCPYVRGVLDRILRDAAALQALGVGVVAISSNDVEAYPQDGPEEMKALAEAEGFSFPYLYDADQSVAKAFGAACTPDFFGFDAGMGLQYRGRLDASGRQAGDAGLRRELFEAMRQVAQTGRGPEDQIPSMGCSIKWKDG
jgi:peroxiredoxin